MLSLCQPGEGDVELECGSDSYPLHTPKSVSPIFVLFLLYNMQNNCNLLLTEDETPVYFFKPTSKNANM